MEAIDLPLNETGKDGMPLDKPWLSVSYYIAFMPA